MSKIVIIDYNAGNVQSVVFALERLGITDAILTNDHEVIKSADKVIFPGVGAAGTTIHYLKDKNLDKLIPQLTQPVLGICLGMQLLCEYSEEDETDCLNIFPLKVKKFVTDQPDIKIPHIGWNKIYDLSTRQFSADSENQHVYFVHSYYVELSDYTTATCDYIQPFSAAIQKDNFYATQFHPEKSGTVGESILRQFLAL